MTACTGSRHYWPEIPADAGPTPCLCGEEVAECTTEGDSRVYAFDLTAPPEGDVVR